MIVGVVKLAPELPIDTTFLPRPTPVPLKGHVVVAATVAGVSTSSPAFAP